MGGREEIGVTGKEVTKVQFNERQSPGHVYVKRELFTRRDMRLSTGGGRGVRDGEWGSSFIQSRRSLESSWSFREELGSCNKWECRPVRKGKDVNSLDMTILTLYWTNFR